MANRGRPPGGPFDWFRNPLPKQRKGILTQLRIYLRRKHYALETEKSYVNWVRRYVRFHNLRHPKDMGAAEITAFLEYLAVERKVSAKTQNLALSAIVFFYRNVMRRELKGIRQSAAAKEKRRLPVVLSRDEASRVLSLMKGQSQLVGQLMYGSGLRLREALQLRVKDIDFDTPAIMVREGKGGKDRVAILPRSLLIPLREQIARVQRQHVGDVRAGAGWVEMPHALSRKYVRAGQSLPWQWIFPAARIHIARENGERRRHHLHPTVVQKAVRRAALASGIMKRVTCHTFRHSFATELLNNNVDIRTIQKLLGHKNVKTTMLYTHLEKKAVLRVQSPMDMVGAMSATAGSMPQEDPPEIQEQELPPIPEEWEEDEFDD